MKRLKRLYCQLLHKVTFVSFAFTDIVSGERVFYFRCKKCKTTWLANDDISLLRMYTDTNPQIK